MEPNSHKKGLRKTVNKLPEYLDSVYKLKLFISNLDRLYEESNLIIDGLGRDARMFYLSQIPLQKTSEMEIALPEDAKRKIDDIIIQSIQKRGKIETKKEDEGN